MRSPALLQVIHSSPARQTAPSSAFPLLLLFLLLLFHLLILFLLHHLLFFLLLLLFFLLCHCSIPLRALERDKKGSEKQRRNPAFPPPFSDVTHLCPTVRRFPVIVWRRAAYVLKCLRNIDSLLGKKTQTHPEKCFLPTVFFLGFLLCFFSRRFLWNCSSPEWECEFNR